MYCRTCGPLKKRGQIGKKENGQMQGVDEEIGLCEIKKKNNSCQFLNCPSITYDQSEM